VGQTARAVNWIASRSSSAAPGRSTEDVYRWNSGFDATAFLARLAELMKASGCGGPVSPAGFDEGGAWQHFDGSDELRFPIFQKGFTPQTYSQFVITFHPPTRREADRKVSPCCPTSWVRRISSSTSAIADNWSSSPPRISRRGCGGAAAVDAQQSSARRRLQRFRADSGETGQCAGKYPHRFGRWFAPVVEGLGVSWFAKRPAASWT